MESNETDTAEKVIYAAIVILYIYSLADQLTDGQLRMNLSMSLTRFRGKLKGFWNKQKAFEKSLGKMLWTAEEVLERGE